jgi:hypothetical protein
MHIEACLYEDHRIYEVQDFGVQKFSEATMGKNSFLKN